MALVLPGKFLFLHVPKTGGKWVKYVLHRAFPESTMLRRTNHGNRWAHFGHGDLEDVADREEFRFAFVRHPVDFWRSYYRYRARTKWEPNHEIDSLCMDHGFDKYIDNVLKNLNGYASRMYSRYVGEPGSEIDFIGKQENLIKDLSKALMLAGMDPAQVDLNSRPKNTGAPATEDIGFTAEQYTDLAEAEREGIERFGY